MHGSMSIKLGISLVGKTDVGVKSGRGEGGVLSVVLMPWKKASPGS
jgi:hypothetical protein